MTNGYIDIPTGDLRDHLDTTVVMTVDGTGLEPTLLKGDRVRVDRTRAKPKKGELVVVKVLGGYLAGKWHRQGKRRLLVAIHPATRPVDLSLHDAWDVVGVITAVVDRKIGGEPIGTAMSPYR